MNIIDNKELMHEVIENMEYLVRVIDEECRVVYLNQKMRQIFGYTIGNYCYELFGGSKQCENCLSKGSKKTGKPDQKDVAIGNKFYRVMTSPIKLKGKESLFIELFHDITREKKTEIELLAHYEKLKEDIKFAKQIQFRALPTDGNYWGLMKIDSLYIQCEDLGGDFYDIIRLDENRMLLYIADISGHGVKSSLLTIFLRQVIRGAAKREGTNLRDLLDEMLKSYKELHTNLENYLTLICGIYDKKNNTMSFINAGHNCMPILISESKGVREIPVKGLPICCLFEEIKHEQIDISLQKGDRIMLYTDGISESYSKVLKKQFGSEGIIDTLEELKNAESHQLCSRIIQSSAAFAGIVPNDDMAILVAEAL